MSENKDTKETGPQQRMSCHRIAEKQIRCIDRNDGIKTTYTIDGGVITNDDSPIKGYYTNIRGRHKVISWHDTRYGNHRVLWDQGKKRKLL